MKFYKVLFFVAGVFLFASCDFMNQKDNFVGNLGNNEVASSVDEETSIDVPSGKVILVIGNSKSRMILPDNNENLSAYSNWNVTFENKISGAKKTFEVVELSSVFTLPLGSYSVSVSGSRNVTSDDGEKVTYFVSGTSEVELVEAGETVNCSVLMGRNKTDSGYGSFKYQFKLPYSDICQEGEGDFNPLENHLFVTLTDLNDSSKKIEFEESEGTTKPRISFQLFDENGDEEYDVYQFNLEYTKLDSGYYRLSVVYYPYLKKYTSEDDTWHYSKAIITVPETLVEIADGRLTECSYSDSFTFKDYSSINNFTDLENCLKKGADYPDGILNIDLSNERLEYAYKINELVGKYGKKVDLSLCRFYEDESSITGIINNYFSNNTYITGVTYNSDYVRIPDGCFNNCVNLKYVRFTSKVETEVDGNGETQIISEPEITIDTTAFSDCYEDLTFLVPNDEYSMNYYRSVFDDLFGSGNYNIAGIVE